MVERVVYGVAKQICVTSRKHNRILRCPPPHSRIIIPHAEPRKLRLWIVQAASKDEGLEARIGVLGDVAEFVVIEALGNGAICCVDDQPRAAEVIGEDAVGDAGFHYVVRHVRATSVHKR